MYTRRDALRSAGVLGLVGFAGCTEATRVLERDREREDPFEPDVTPEPLPDDASLPPGFVHSESAPYVAVEDRLTVSNAHRQFLADRPAFRHHETVTTTLFDSGAEVVDWAVEGEALHSHITRRETTVTDAAYLKTQRYEYTDFPYETSYPQQAFEFYVDYTEYFAVDARAIRFDADYERFGVEEGEIQTNWVRYSSPRIARDEFEKELAKQRDITFGGGNLREAVLVEGGLKLKQYEDFSAPEDEDGEDPHPTMDRHEYATWVFDTQGYARERVVMAVYPKDEGRLSVTTTSQRWKPLAESPGPLRPDWVDAEDAAIEYPDEWWEEYEGPRDA